MKRAKWIPKVGERYFCIGINGDKIKILDSRRAPVISRTHFKTNCFRTKREAIAAKKKIVKVLGG